jgi:periplasmic divalent cation tolerance protein
MIYFAYVTTDSAEEAKNLAYLAVKEKLAACANIIPGMESVYEWQGQIEHAKEWVVIFKCSLQTKAALSQRLIQAHSYDCPCVLFFTADQVDGNPEYMRWIKNQLI